MRSVRYCGHWRRIFAAHSAPAIARIVPDTCCEAAADGRARAKARARSSGSVARRRSAQVIPPRTSWIWVGVRLRHGTGHRPAAGLDEAPGGGLGWRRWWCGGFDFLPRAAGGSSVFCVIGGYCGRSRAAGSGCLRRDSREAHSFFPILVLLRTLLLESR